MRSCHGQRWGGHLEGLPGATTRDRLSFRNSRNVVFLLYRRAPHLGVNAVPDECLIGEAALACWTDCAGRVADRAFGTHRYARSTSSLLRPLNAGSRLADDTGWSDKVRARLHCEQHPGARVINRSRVVERSGALWPRLEQHPDQFGLPMRIRLIENSFKMSACVTDRDADLVSRFGNALSTGQ
jgi:hypothetical protein